jgi:hypothetical protein
MNMKKFRAFPNGSPRRIPVRGNAHKPLHGRIQPKLRCKKQQMALSRNAETPKCSAAHEKFCEWTDAVYNQNVKTLLSFS